LLASEDTMMILYLVLGFTGFVSNGATLVYIVTSFDVTTHVFLLLFIDALFSTISCIVCFISDLGLLLDLVNTR
jgi:hypothetical protein